MQKFKLRIIVEADLVTPHYGIGRMRPVWLGFDVKLDCGHAMRIKRKLAASDIGNTKVRCYQCGGTK